MLCGVTPENLNISDLIIYDISEKSAFYSTKKWVHINHKYKKTIKMCTLNVYLTCKDIIDGYITWHFYRHFLKMV